MASLVRVPISPPFPQQVLLPSPLTSPPSFLFCDHQHHHHSSDSNSNSSPAAITTSAHTSSSHHHLQHHDHHMDYCILSAAVSLLRMKHNLSPISQLPPFSGCCDFSHSTASTIPHRKARILPRPQNRSFHGSLLPPSSTCSREVAPDSLGLSRKRKLDQCDFDRELQENIVPHRDNLHVVVVRRPRYRLLSDL